MHDASEIHNKQRDTYYQSIDDTLVSSSTPHHSYVEGDEEKMYAMPSLRPFEKKNHDFTSKNSTTKLPEENDTVIENMKVQVMNNSNMSPFIALASLKPMGKQ